MHTMKQWKMKSSHNQNLKLLQYYKTCKDMTISRKMLSYSLHKFSSLTINFSLFFSLSVDEDFCFVVAADPGADGGDTVIWVWTIWKKYWASFINDVFNGRCILKGPVLAEKLSFSILQSKFELTSNTLN